MTIMASLDEAARQIIEVGRRLGGLNYHAALAGNISIRVAADRLLCSRHGADKASLTPDDLVLCDLDGNKVEGKGKPTSELNMHRTAYRLRENVRGVIHAHPLTATACAAASVPLDQLQLPEMTVILGPVALVPYATPGSEELAQQLGRYLPTHDAFLLENHGALTVGGSLAEAARRMELLEQNAKITLLVRQIGKPFALQPEDLSRLLEFRERMRVIPEPFET